MSRRVLVAVLALLPALPARAAPEPAGEAPREPARVVLLSIDGLRPSSYMHPDELGLAVPNLRRLVREGAFASGVEGVLPTVTYPSHTTMITGVPPAVHGIFGNTLVDPTGLSNDAWYWYASSVRVPTLVSAVRARGGTVGAVLWPVTVGLDADWLVPEFWRTGSMHPSDLELLRALSTPGLVEGVEQARGAALGIPVTDADRTDLALAILRDHCPELLLVHLAGVDHEEHLYGPEAPESRAAIEEADRNLGRLLAALDGSGLAASTLLVVVSDHGFGTATKLVRPNALLAENGLLEVDDKGKITSWKAWFLSHGGSASLHLADPDDTATLAKVRALLAAKLGEPQPAIRAILERPEIAALGGDPRAALFVDAADGWFLSRTPTGGWAGEPHDRGYHGYDPRRPMMHASLLVRSPGLSVHGDLGVVAMTRIAPTVARFLGVAIDPAAAAALDLFGPAAAGALAAPAAGR
ncbi:MAG: alkaline phosphatase family protein [Thermoanaerobaculia bacterium]